MLKRATDYNKSFVFSPSFLPENTARAVLEYMMNRGQVIAAGGAVYDRFADTIANVENLTYKDEVYHWTSEEAYYIGNYGLPVHPDFVEHVLSKTN